jgi:uncharacterized protein (TIGR02284 family)
MSVQPAQHHDNKKLVTTLNHLLETCIDAEKGYAYAAADVRDVELKKTLLKESEKRADFSLALAQAIRSLDAMPMSEGRAVGALHRAWMGLRKAVEGRSDKLLLEEVLVAEENAREKYAGAMFELAAAGWTPAIRTLVSAQYTQLRAAQEELGWHLKTLMMA